MNFVVPSQTAPGTASLIIQSAGSPDTVLSAEIRTMAPALFTVNETGQGVAAATAVRFVAGQQSVVPVFSCSGSACSAVPIDLGAGAPVYLSLYGTGIRNRSSLTNVTCTIGGVSVPVLYAGPQPQYAGLDQVNVALTSSLSGLGETDLVVSADGRTSNPVRINVR